MSKYCSQIAAAVLYFEVGAPVGGLVKLLSKALTMCEVSLKKAEE